MSESRSSDPRSATVCATCGAPLGTGALFSDSGDPICERCSGKEELEHGEVRASRAIFASSPVALGLSVLAVFYDPCLIPTIAAIAAGIATLTLLWRHPQHRKRLGARSPIAAGLAIAGILFAVPAPFVGLALTAWWTHRHAEALVAPAVTPDAETVAEEEVVDPRRDIFASRVPAWVVALDRRSAGRERPPPEDVASMRGAVLAAVDADMPSAHDAFAAFLDDADAFSRATGDVDDAALTNQLVLLDAAIAEAGAPYYLDALLTASSERRRVLSSAYHVTRRRRYRSGELTVNELDLERIDSLSFERSLLGYTRPEVRYALVLVSRVENFLVRQVLPSIHSADESVTVRDYADERGTEWVTPFENAVHEDLRAEAVGLVNERALGQLAAAVVQRRIALDALEHAVDGIRILDPDTIAFDMSQLAGFTRMAGPYVAEVRAAQDRLEGAEARRTYEALEEVFLASIARHEVQHRLDYEADRMVAVPDALAAYTGRTEAENMVNHLAERSNAELSAYLSQLARDPQRPLTTMVHVIGFVMARDAWGMPESYAAVVLFERLAHELGIAHEDFVVDHDVHREPIAAVYMAARTRPSAEIVAAAARAWAGLYGTELPPMEERPEGSL